jgi:two-component system, NtrC family, nitrogen regulation response regulator NtrX
LILNRGEVIDAEDVEVALGNSQQLEGADYPASVFELPLRDARDRFERSYLQHHLQRVGGNVSELAQMVGMERTHLYRKLKGLGIDPKMAKNH